MISDELSQLSEDNFMIEGDSMKDCGLLNGMFVKINKTIEAEDKKIVVAKINGKLFVKEFRMINKKVEFHSKNKNYPNITQYDDYEILGVVEGFFGE